jgi:peptidoglycan hydrolase CwlO-like protein
MVSSEIEETQNSLRELSAQSDRLKEIYSDATTTIEKLEQLLNQAKADTTAVERDPILADRARFTALFDLVRSGERK